MPIRLEPADDLRPLATALLGGGIAIVPTDTVYGICCRASEEAACAEIARLKGRDPSQPSSVLFADLAAARALARDLRADALLGTGATLIVPNPAGRYPWLCGATPDRIGLRFAALDPRLAAVLAPLGPLLATSANVHGGRDPATLEEVPVELSGMVDCVVEGGRLTGVPSTVLDLTGAEPVILRAGAPVPHPSRSDPHA